MTLDERLEYLAQSIESHDRHLAELVDTVAQTGRQLQATDRQLQETNRQLQETNRQLQATDARLKSFIEVTELNFQRLARAMEGLTEHAASHQERLSRLEQQSGQPPLR